MPVLNVEHVACNVADPTAMAAWYVEHLGMRVVRKISTAPVHPFPGGRERPRGHRDLQQRRRSGSRLRGHAPDGWVHFAFAAEDPDAARAALVAAGATFVEEQSLADGSRLLMLRDPWGLPLQLCKRTTPLLPER